MDILIPDLSLINAMRSFIDYSETTPQIKVKIARQPFNARGIVEVELTPLKLICQ
jgi:hypothetical protein